MGLYYILVLFIMILCCGLVSLRLSVMILCYGMGLYRGLALLSIAGKLYPAIFKVYSIDSCVRCYHCFIMLLTAGQASREPGQLAPEGIPPEGDSDPAQEPQGVV